ncbi:PAS domain-containing sensor histidine kinase [Mucilaginibacter terrenus]|nr:ATP-binding protein [Mucilaginibacter terrenus]
MAERAVDNAGENNATGAEQDVQAILQELQVHQIELEMQNDELKLANEELELQQLRFSSIYNLAPIGYFILNSSGVVTDVNNAGLTLLETGKMGLASKRLIQFVVPVHTDVFYRFYHEMSIRRARESCQLTMRSQTGREFHAQIEGIAIKAALGEQPQYYVAIIDISESIEARRALAETKDRLQLSLEASAAGTWELDLETMEFYLDEFNRNILGGMHGNGFDRGYKNFINILHPEDREMVDHCFRNSINFDKEIDVVTRIMNAEGGLSYASIRGHVIHEAGNVKRLAGIIIDITEKRRIEEETIKLKRNQQNEISLATLTAEENERRRISDSLHDSVSQLLYGIKIKLGLLNSGRPLNNEQQDINLLIDQAIAETRNISFELAPSILTDFGLPATIEELAKRLSSSKMHIQTRATGFHQRPDIVLETSIFRIIQELLNNCMKHSGASQVKIEIKKNKHIEIHVKDNGVGFRYKENERAVSGSGLSSIKNRVNLYNGKLDVQSAPGKGTAVNITLNF